MTLTDQEKRMMQRMENSIAATPTQAQIEAAAQAIAKYLEKLGQPLPLPKTDGTILANIALTAAAEVNEHDRPDAGRSDLCNNNGDNPRFETSQQPDRFAQIEAALTAAATQAQIEAWRDVVEQAMACIRGETPEDISFGEAEDNTLSKLKQVDAEMSAALTAEKEITSVDVALAVEATTIERCEQAAYKYAMQQLALDKKITPEGIVNAIRALKDKP